MVLLKYESDISRERADSAHSSIGIRPMTYNDLHHPYHNRHLQVSQNQFSAALDSTYSSPTTAHHYNHRNGTSSDECIDPSMIGHFPMSTPEQIFLYKVHQEANKREDNGWSCQHDSQTFLLKDHASLVQHYLSVFFYLFR